MLAIVSKRTFENDIRYFELKGQVGEILPFRHYESKNRHLDRLQGGSLFLVTVRPGGKLWLVSLYEKTKPRSGRKKYGVEADGEVNQIPITDITHLHKRFKFESGTCLSEITGYALQTPRVLTKEDERLLRDLLAIPAATPTKGENGPTRKQEANKDAEPPQFEGPKEIPIENTWTETFLVAPSQEVREAERREAELLQSFRHYLTKKGHQTCRYQIVPQGESKPLFCDLFDKTMGLLVEAKGVTTREAVRMAIGQLADYKRFIKPAPQLAVLLPSKPQQDLLALLADQTIGVIWSEGGGFMDSKGGALCASPPIACATKASL